MAATSKRAQTSSWIALKKARTARVMPIWVTAPTRERAMVPEAMTPNGILMSKATVSPATA